VQGGDSGVAAADVGEAYIRYRGRILGFFACRLRDAGRAEDLTQDVFAAATACRTRLGADGRDLLPWLSRVAQRRYVDELREQERHPLDSLERVADCGVDGPETRAGSGGLLAEGITALPQDQREVLVGHLVQGSSFAEIGSELGRSEAACKMSFQRGLKTLRQFLIAAGVSGASSGLDQVARYF
jgi:RNA polymerase sigma factor (sigma-70 family)